MPEAEDAWMGVARDNLRAARGLAVSHPRSSVSRAYYAAFAAAHAMLLSAGATARPGLGTWPHPDLPALLKSVLARGSMPVSRGAPKTSQVLMLRCYSARLQADYSPATSMDRSFAEAICRDAGRVVGLAERIRA